LNNVPQFVTICGKIANIKKIQSCAFCYGSWMCWSDGTWTWLYGRLDSAVRFIVKNMQFNT